MKKAKGTIHPLTDIIRQVSKVFVDMGFEIADGSHIEDEWHNFDALNVPKDHPARDMQDTFFIKKRPGFVLRTHTSNIQARFMEDHKPPVKVISPGTVYRNEATDATHEAQFHQIDGFVVGEGVTMGDLKGTLEKFLKGLFGEDVEMRFRPGYFPFVEPGVEVDLKFQGKWLEVLGAGMVHPNVLKALKIDPEKYTGFAFGVGVDRLAMMKWNVPDVRMFYQGDLRLNESLK